MVVNGLNTKYASGSIIEGNSKARAQAGQSLLEFVLMLPVIFGLAKVIYRANMAIQQSIVNQQYARQQTLIITEHSPNYPPKFRMNRSPGSRQRLVDMKTNVLLVGVSENPFKEATGDQDPEAPMQLIARSPAAAGGKGPAAEEPSQRSWVRIRTTVALCTPSVVINTENGIVEAGPMNVVSGESSMYCHNPYNDGAAQP